MHTTLGKIVASTSHILYEARIYDSSECAHPPTSQDYAFGSLVGITPFDKMHQPNDSALLVGVIANSRLLNPDLGHYGPRLTIPQEQNAIFAPDYLNELGVIVNVLLIGYLHERAGQQEIVREVLSVGDEVRTLSDEEFERFHRSTGGSFQMRYAPLIMESGTQLTTPLIQSICQQLEPLCTPKEQQMLTVLRKHLVLQSTFATGKGR